MATLRLTDEDGYGMTVIKHNDIYYPAWTTPESLDRVKDLEMRSDDVLLLTYPKTGTHWIGEIVSMLLDGKAELDVNIQTQTFLEDGTLSADSFAKLQSPRLLNTHLRASQIPVQSLKKKSRMIIGVRNPKDTIVSFYHHAIQVRRFDYDGSFQGYLSLAMKGTVPFGSWFDYYRAAEKLSKENKDGNILIVYYEDMKEDLPKAIQKIANFLEILCSSDFLAKVADKATFKNVKQTKELGTNELWNTRSKTGKFNFFRKGDVGDWKNYFTVAENGRFDKLYSEKMAGSSLRIRFEL